MFSNKIYSIGNQIQKKLCDYMNEYNKYDNKDKEKLYIVGNGWASYYFVKYLDKTKFTPIIIAPNSKVLNTPKLVDYIVNSDTEFEFENPYGIKILDMVEDIKVDEKIIITKSGSKYNYGRVIFAIGSEPNDYGISGVFENTYKLKSIQDAYYIKVKLQMMKENSTIYIIGSGITGIELGSKLIKNNYDIKIIEGMDKILSGLNNNTKNIIYEYLINSNKPIEIKLSHMVKSIDSKKITIEHNKLLIDNNYDKFNDIIIWTGGIRFNGYNKTKLYHSLNKITQIKPRGIEVKENFLLDDNTNSIYCIGDMVSNAGPPTAQNAKNQGIWLAKYFNSGCDDNFIKSNPYEIKSNGKIIHLDKKIYLESKFYSGFIFNFIGKIIDLFL